MFIIPTRIKSKSGGQYLEIKSAGGSIYSNSPILNPSSQQGLCIIWLNYTLFLSWDKVVY